MLKIKEYVKVNSLEEAYELNQKKSSRVLGGMVWMKMMNRSVGPPLICPGWDWIGLQRQRRNL